MAVYDLNCKNKYYQLYSHIREDILRGKFKAGERLPAKRALALELGVSVVTVQLAYEQLLAEGYITSRERSGYFVEKVSSLPENRQKTERVRTRSEEKKYALDFVKSATPAELFPFSVWARLMRKVLSNCGEHLLERVPCDGDAELKEEISAYLYRTRGIDADPRYIVIGAGAEYLYGVIVQLLGRDKVYAVENPGYAKICAAYRLNDAKYIPVPVGKSGISVEKLIKSSADVLHISPAHQFPTGVVTPASTRLQIIEWAADKKYVIEDDYDSEFRLSGKPLQSLYSLCPDRVIYMNTFSKSLAPSMRMGYMVLPPALYERFIDIFASSANVVPLFEQKTLAAMLREGHFERHINRMKTYYRGVRDALVEMLKKFNTSCKIVDTGSGLHMLVRFPHASDARIKEAAERAQIRLRCLSDYLISPIGGMEGYAVINYAGVTENSLFILHRLTESEFVI